MSNVIVLAEFELLTPAGRYDIVEHRPTPDGVGKVRVFLVTLDGDELGWAYERLTPPPRPHLHRFSLDTPNGMSLMQTGGDTLAEAADALLAHRRWLDHHHR